MYPSRSNRQKLVVAGIPESEHSAKQLASHLPDFDPEATAAMSADALAEVVLYLINKGVVQLPVLSQHALLDLPWGSHVCQFYNRKEELLELLVPYFKQGLSRNEACVWLVDELTVQEATAALRAAVPDLDTYLESKQLQVRHYTDLYTDAAGAVRDSNELSDAFVAMGASVSQQGYAGLRASGGVGWVCDAEGMSRFMAYESKVNVAIQNARIMAVCTYPTQSAKLSASREIIHSHGKFFVKRGCWVHDRSREARQIERVFASLAGEPAHSHG